MEHGLISDKCPQCGGQMVFDNFDFYRCSNCGGEFWPNPFEKKVDTEELMARDEVKHAVSVFDSNAIMGPGYKVPRKGNSKSGRRRKNPPKKPIYEYAKNYKET